jgi:tRNA threonylcarbamoyladenosine biosynthesis protein TsaB
MPSFREVSDYSNVLVIDAASALIQVGFLSTGGEARWSSSAEESGVGIFQCLESLRIAPLDAGTIIFCEGPGSVLGIRTAAMAIRTWGVMRPARVLSYLSLALVAHAAKDPALTVIADARRECWHQYTMAGGLVRVEASALNGKLRMPENFRHWSALPPGVEIVPYRLSELIPAVSELDLLRECPEPDAFLHEEPSYVTWVPKIHRAPL